MDIISRTLLYYAYITDRKVLRKVKDFHSIHAVVIIKRERGLENVVYSGVGEGGTSAGPCQGIPSPEGPDIHWHSIEQSLFRAWDGS